MPDVMAPVVFSFGAFGQFLPPYHSLIAQPPTPEVIANLRKSELMAVGVCIGVAALASAIAKDPLPVYAALTTALALLVLYEHALRNEPQ